MSNWIATEIAKVKEFFTSETAELKAEVSALKSRLSALEAKAAAAVKEAV